MRSKYDVTTIERDILQIVYDLGPITPGSPALDTLMGKYPLEEGAVDSALSQATTVMLNFLLEERYLFPFFNGTTGEELRNYVARGITPKGIDRLNRLRHPVRYWMGTHWFPLVVACVTTAVGLASVVVQLVS